MIKQAFDVIKEMYILKVIGLGYSCMGSTYVWYSTALLKNIAFLAVIINPHHQIVMEKVICYLMKSL